MSSAILYVAIVAIWAVVLIPRWLRRDSSERASDVTATAEDTAEDTAEADERPTPELALEPAPRPRLRPRLSRPQVSQVSQDRGENGRWREGSGDTVRDREHARVLSSRRRMLGLLLLIAIGSAALAVTRTAAWWVLGPPSAMLLGYLALLREASKADAERRELSRARTARVAVADEAGLAPRPVHAPEAEIIEISASRGPADEGLYDQYSDAKLRAVGD